MNEYYRISIYPPLRQADRDTLFEALRRDRATIHRKYYYYEVWQSDDPRGGNAPDIAVTVNLDNILILEVGHQQELRDEILLRARALEGYLFSDARKVEDL